MNPDPVKTNHLPDTSFLFPLFRHEIHTDKAFAYANRLSRPLAVTSFALLEFRQAVRLQVFLNRHDKSKGMTKVKADEVLRLLQDALRLENLAVVPVDWSDVHLVAETLGSKYVERGGHRLADLLHVAAALHVGAEEFLTFDERQRRLAEAEGLRIPV